MPFFENSVLAFEGNGSKSELRRAKWKVLGQQRQFPHLERKLYHIVNGLFCFVLYAFVLTRNQSLWVLGLVGGVWLLVDVLRFRVKPINEMALKLFGRVMRREELKSLTANSYYILGLFMVAFIFPRPIVCLSILYLALGDPIAAIVGTRWGKYKIGPKKSLEGALGNLVVSFLATYIFAATTGFLFPGRLAIVGSMCSVFSELVPSKLDDNLTIPVISATLLWAVSQLIPLFVM